MAIAIFQGLTKQLEIDCFVWNPIMFHSEIIKTKEKKKKTHIFTFEKLEPVMVFHL